MTRDAKGNQRACARIVTAAIALVTSGCMMMSGAVAEPATAEGSSEIEKDGKGFLVLPGSSQTGQKSEKNQAGETVVAKAQVDVSPEEARSSDSGVTVIAKGQSESEDGHSTAAAKTSTKSAKKHKSDDTAFRSGPQYESDYDAEEQAGIYGGKSPVEPPRPLLELGREQYTSGIYDESSTVLGKLNPLLPGLAIYGDWRTAVAYNNNNGKEIAQIATRVNLDVDFKITGTERIHAFFAPIQRANAEFTRYEFGGSDANDRFNDELDGNPQTLFFEGDAGSIYSGYSGQEASFDLPFTFGLFPLFLQNGIWANDAILGGAFTLPALNSPTLGLSNYDITFFAAFDNVDNAGVIGADGKADNNSANLYGVTAFIDAFSGYVEAGYGLVQGTGNKDGLIEHYLTAAYTRRYGNTLSNSTRLFANFGDGNDGKGKNSDGFAIISENSLISYLPSTLLPYANFFVGFDSPKPLVDGNGAGILKNVGINFETDALTGYPKMDDTGSNAWGGAIGLQYLFNLDQQIVFEVATVQPFEDDGIGAKDAQYGFGVRYQIPINRAWLFRADATYQIIESAEDNFGVRSEVRRKF